MVGPLQNPQEEKEGGDNLQVQLEQCVRCIACCCSLARLRRSSAILVAVGSLTAFGFLLFLHSVHTRLPALSMADLGARLHGPATRGGSLI